MLTPKPVRVFDRENPCSKVDLHLCFYPQGRYKDRAVVEARGEIGINAIKYLKKQGYANAVETAGVEYWTLSEEGKSWLAEGLKRHLELHPEDKSRLPSATRARPRPSR